MQFFLPGIDRMMKGPLTDMLGNEKIPTALKDVSSIAQSFRKSESVFSFTSMNSQRILNVLLLAAEASLTSRELKKDRFEIVISMAIGKKRMLVASDHKAIDQVPFFLEAMAVIMYGNKERPDVTKLITIYAEILRFFDRKHRAALWTRDELAILNYRLVEFRKLENFVFETYQLLGMSTKK